MSWLPPVVCALALGLPLSAQGQPARPEKPRTMAEVLAASQPSDWRPLDPENTLYLELASGRVVIELAPAFAPKHVANVKALVREGYFDGLAIVRSQDNYVVQWGDPEAGDAVKQRKITRAQRTLPAEFTTPMTRDLAFNRLADGDGYAREVGFSGGFPAARDAAEGRAWLAHCYGMVGAGRDNDADSGGGPELYVVIGHAPRHLDRNVTLLGRVVSGVERLSTLPRGSGALGFYERSEERVPIRAMRVAADLPAKERTALEVIRTDTQTFEALVEARRNRRDEWFKVPAGHVELCNVPIAVRPVAERSEAGAAPGQRLFADRVLVGGRVLTVDASDSVAEAVAIKDGRILAVGTNIEIEALAGPSTERIDLHGLTATPGLLDAHCHFAAGALDRLYVLDLSYPAVKSIGDVTAKVKSLAEQSRPGAWLEGRGWDEGKLKELRYIYATDLDAVSADRPVWLTQTMGHYGVANSLALKLAGITRGTPDPPGGTIDRRADGTPSGVLKESAQALVERLIPEPSPEQRRQAIRSLALEFGKEGMTGLKDPGIGPEAWDAYQQVLAEGALSVRVFALWHGGASLDETRQMIEHVASFTKPYRSTGDDHLVSGGIKLFMDGSGGARTAWLYDAWNKNSREIDGGNHGYPAADPELRREQIRLYHDAGLHVSVHAIGDRAIDWVVDSYKLALDKNPIKGLRHGVIHANIPTDHAIETLATLQQTYDAGYPEPSATFMWWIGDTYAGNFGPARSLRLNPFKSYLAKGMRWADGSDFNVTPFPARYGLWAALARETLLGVYGANPYGREEAIDIRSALRARTLWAARQMFLEQKIGSIEAGKYADIAVWDKDLYAVPPADLKNLECQMTLFEGRIVYRAPGSPVTVSKGR